MDWTEWVHVFVELILLRIILWAHRLDKVQLRIQTILQAHAKVDIAEKLALWEAHCGDVERLDEVERKVSSLQGENKARFGQG